MTGQSVQFEQKFNYRRPMYTVMAYLWEIPEHRNNFKLVHKLLLIRKDNIKIIKRYFQRSAILKKNNNVAY